jgi:hypothetical protein
LVECSICETLGKSLFAEMEISANRQGKRVSDKLDTHKIQELKEMVNNREPDQPVEKVLAVFCGRHSVTMGTCRYYYNLLVEKGEITEK